MASEELFPMHIKIAVRPDKQNKLRKSMRSQKKVSPKYKSVCI